MSELLEKIAGLGLCVPRKVPRISELGAAGRIVFSNFAVYGRENQGHEAEMVCSSRAELLLIHLILVRRAGWHSWPREGLRVERVGRITGGNMWLLETGLCLPRFIL